MPSHPIHSALIQMGLDEKDVPWKLPQWQKLTGVAHGLFPTDDDLLPKGWTRQDALQVRSYHDQYSKKTTHDARIALSTGRAVQLPGREVWKKWVTLGWKEWCIHAKITQILTENQLHPLAIMRASRSGSEEWPRGDDYIPLVVDSVAMALFGREVLDSLGRVSGDARKTVQALIQRTWTNLRAQVGRGRSRLSILEQAAIDAFESWLDS